MMERKGDRNIQKHIRLGVDKKVEIESLLTDEILKRYFYREGLYEYQITHNPEILEAVAVLKDAGRYGKILR